MSGKWLLDDHRNPLQTGDHSNKKVFLRDCGKRTAAKRQVCYKSAVGKGFGVYHENNHGTNEQQQGGSLESVCSEQVRQFRVRN